MSGPREVFEGKRGFIEAIAGPFRMDCSKQDAERITQRLVRVGSSNLANRSMGLDTECDLVLDAAGDASA